MKLFTLALLLLCSLVNASFLCSALCKPGSCSAANQNSCTDCPTNWSYASSVCSLTSGIGYNLVAKSQDLSGGSSDLALLPAVGSSNCGDYTYYGQSTCSSNLEIKMNSGISTPHYAIQLICWVFLYDDTTWANTNIISLNLGSQTITRGFGTYDEKMEACDSKYQTYFRIQANFDHINATSSPLAISISTDATDSNCKWGLKQAILLQKPCHSFCTQCSGSLNTQCYSCIASKYLSGNTCSASCLAGYGQVTGSKFCILCNSKCIACSENSTYCSSCQTSPPNQSFLYNLTCQATCPSKTYAKIDDHTCASCSSNCLSCNGSSNCSSCDTGYGLFNFTCLSTCPNKYFMDGNICSMCDSKCLLCLGINTNCSSCVLTGTDQSYLSNSSCVVGCPTGTFSTTNPNICNKCATECSACTGALASDCSACSSGNFLSNQTCAAACLSLYGPQSSSSVCILCNSYCNACAELSDNCSSCVTSGTYESFLDSTNAVYKKCVTSCPSGTFASTANHKCDSCDANCLACGGSATNCYSCNVGDGWLNFVCYTNCPNGYFKDNTNCTICDSKCLLCLGTSTNCSSCVLTGTNQSYLSNSSCVVGCPTGTFPTTNPNICNKCATECSACTGALASDCSACSSGNFLSNQTCAAACLSLYGPQSSSSVCILCNSYCNACAELSDNCSSCVTSGTYESFLDSTNAVYKKCVTSCPSGTFASTANHKCDSCDANCLACGGSATNCYSCNVGDGWLNFVCYTNCPNGYFKDNTNCTICDGLCSTCSISATNCSVCTSSGFLLGSACLASCPDPYYGLSSVCQPCNGACLSCTSSSNATCSSCNATFTLSGTVCDSNCLPGYGISTTPRLCILCTSPCTQCYHSDTFCTQCISAPDQYYLLAVSPTSTCVQTCPNKFYTNLTALACISCQTGCQICVDDQVCTTCNSSHLFYNSSCYSPCPVGTFQANSTDCQACDVYCTACQSSYDNCTGCQLNGTYRAYLLGNYCYMTCPFNYYGNSGGICLGCHANCYACYGGGSNQCTTCKANMMLSGTYCAPTCATGYGRVSTNFISCMTCNSLCKTCYQIPTNCSSCKAPNGFLYDDQNLTYPKCVSTCPNGTYANNITQVCDECLDGCAICNTTVANISCITCSSGYGLFNGTCLSQCPNKYYLSGELCLPCSLYCLVCNSSNISCSSCVTSGANKAYLFNQTCKKTCPSNYYPIGGGAVPTKCIQCDSPCFNCNGIGTNCTTCAPGLVLFNSTCINSCPSGYFLSNITNQCEDFTVLLDLSMSFSDIYNSKIIVQLDFTSSLNNATFPLSTFQTITFSDPLLSLSMFKITYQWKNNSSYTIELQPITYIYLNNIKVTVKTMSKPVSGLNSTDGTPFHQDNYDLSKDLNWNLIKGTQMSNLQKEMMSSLSSASTKIQQFTTLPGVQQFNKAGLGCIIFPGSQLTTASVFIKSMPPPASYEGARFWGSFVLFQIPDWEKDNQKQKLVMLASADSIANNSRLLSQRDLFQIDSIEWRFKRTGFTTIFLLDCYMQIILILFSWALLFIAKKLDGKVRATIISKFYSAFHWLHEISIFYLSLGLVLEFMYFDNSSALRLISMTICLLFNIYYLLYELYIYYDLIKYPTLQIGTPQYRETAKKYGYFLRHIRYQQYDVTEDWNPSHFFRPYNYHIASFYKKYLMIVAVPLFYNFPHYATGSLVIIQLFQIIRLSISWPFASKRRNIIRLCLEFTILIFFITLLLQVIYMDQISKNSNQTIVSASDAFSLLGWIGFYCIFVFNISFVIFFVHDICCYLTTSNSSQMRTIRKDFYYQKILRYQNCAEEYADNQILDLWVIKGDLNDHWLDEKQEIVSDIDITVEKLTLNKMGDLFELQIEKIAVLQMKHGTKQVAKQRLKIRQQITGTISINRQINSTLFGIIKDVFEVYDARFQADFISIKTIAKIDPKKYKIGAQIILQQEPHFQILTINYPWSQKKVIRLPTPEKGFPLSIELFNDFIYDKMLNKKYLY